MGIYHGRKSSGSESTLVEFIAMLVSSSETDVVQVAFSSLQLYRLCVCPRL